MAGLQSPVVLDPKSGRNRGSFRTEVSVTERNPKPWVSGAVEDARARGRQVADTTTSLDRPVGRVCRCRVRPRVTSNRNCGDGVARVMSQTRR